MSRPRNSSHNSPRLDAPGGVAPTRSIADIPSSTRLARDVDVSPTYATDLWDGTLDWLFSEHTLLLGNPLGSAAIAVRIIVSDVDLCESRRAAVQRQDVPWDNSRLRGWHPP